MSFTSSLDDIVSENANKLLGVRPHWKRVRLREVCKILNGYPFESSRFSKECGTPLIRIRDILPGATETFYDGDFDPAFLVQPGELLIGMDGDFNCDYWRGEPALLNQRVCKVIPDENRYSIRFLRHVLPGYLSAIHAKTHSVTVKHLSSKTISDIPLPFPSPDEQRRVVAELETQLTRLDASVTALKRVQANLKRYRASVLKAACEGCLVPAEAELARCEGRVYESGAELLARILSERRSHWNGKGKYKEASPPEVEALPSPPEGWTWSALGQLAWSVKDGPHYSPKYTEKGIPFISGGNVRPEGIDFTDTKFISPELHAELSKRCVPERGDLLYTKGGTTGIARVNTEAREFNVWVHVAVLKLVDSIHRFYLQYALNSPHCYRQSQQHTHGVGNQDLGLTRMVWITVPLPPLAEQERIVAEVEHRLSVIEKLEATVATNLKRAERLRQSVLRRAFSIEAFATQ